MKKVYKKVLCCGVFLIMLVLIISYVSYIVIPNEEIEKKISLYNDQIENSIDIAFIGTSSTHRFYDVMSIWEEYGITSMSYAVSSMPYELNITMIEYVLENQSPEVFVIDLRNLMTEDYNIRYFGTYELEFRKSAFINSMDLFPMNWSSISAILSSDYVESEQYMYIWSLLYNHESFQEQWTLFVENGFSKETYDYKQNELMSFEVSDLTETYVDFDLVEVDEDYVLTEETIERALVLLEYCEEKELNVLFTFTPYVGEKHDADQDTRREIVELVESYGFPIIDYKEQFEEIGLDYTTDFYDKNHTNVLGAEKYTLYMMEDLLEIYGVDATYSEEVVEDWNQELEEWNQYYDVEIQALYEAIEEIQES